MTKFISAAAPRSSPDRHNHQNRHRSTDQRRRDGSVFAIPGLCLLTLNAIQGGGYPTVQALIILFPVVYVLINLFIDVLSTPPQSGTESR